MPSFELGRTPHDAIWNNPLGVKDRPVSSSEYATWVSHALHASTVGYPELSLLTTQDEFLMQSMACLGLPQYPPHRSIESKSALFVEPKIYHAYEHHGINIGQLRVNLAPRFQRGIGEAEWNSTSPEGWDGLGDAVRRMTGGICAIDEAVGESISPFTHDFPVGFVWDEEGYIASWEAQINFGKHIIHPILPWVETQELFTTSISNLVEAYAEGLSDITSPISVECGYAYVHEKHGDIEYFPVTMSSYFLPQWYTKLSGSDSVDAKDNPIGKSIYRLETGDELFERWDVKFMRPNRRDSAKYMEVKVGSQTGKFFQFEGVEAYSNVRTVHGFQHTDMLGYFENARTMRGSSMVQLFENMKADVESAAIQRMQMAAQVSLESITELLFEKLDVGKGDRTRVRKYVESILSSFPASLASLP